MPSSRASVVGGLLTALALSAGAAPAVAAPVTVDVRVEGPTSTLFEGPVTTDVRPFRFNTGPDQAPRPCDGTSATGGPSPVPVPTAGGALAATIEQGVILGGTHFSFGPSIESVNGVNTAFDPGTNRYLVEFQNFVPGALGSCSTEIRTGDQVLFAYGSFGEPALKLTGPATVAPGATATVQVVDGATNAPVAGATVGGATTDGAGAATVGPFTVRGPQPLKASKTGTIRSNRLALCVTDGADGFCGTSLPGQPPAPAAPAAPVAPCVTTGDDGRCGTADRRPALGAITSVAEGRRFAKGKGPRTLAGKVDESGSGVAKVRLRLTRTDRRTVRGKRRNVCFTFDGEAERLTTMRRCGATRGEWFEVAESADWSYLLPSRLPRGRYVLDVETTDRAGNVDRTLQRTRNRVVFFVA